MRWDGQAVEGSTGGRLPGIPDDAPVRHFRSPDAMDVRFHEIHARSALNRVPGGSRAPFRWTVNPYRGCTHACVYCFARPTHEYLGMDAGRDFEREIVVKVNVPEVLRAELARPSWAGEHVALGTNTDPYQWVEGRYRLMRGVWEAMRDAANPCSILTKSPLVLRDVDLLREIAAVTHVQACLSIPTLNQKAWRATEPHTPSPQARLEAVAELNRQGIPTGILVAPLIPGVNDDPRQIAEIVQGATDAGATSLAGGALWLRGEVRNLMFDWVRQQRPDLLAEYERLYARGTYMPAADRERIEAPLRGWRPAGAAAERRRAALAARRRAEGTRRGVAGAAIGPDAGARRSATEYRATDGAAGDLPLPGRFGQSTLGAEALGVEGGGTGAPPFRRGARSGRQPGAPQRGASPGPAQGSLF